MSGKILIFVVDLTERPRLRLVLLPHWSCSAFKARSLSSRLFCSIIFQFPDDLNCIIMDNPFFITFNPHFNEYHVIRVISMCSVFHSKDKYDCQTWIAKHGGQIQLELF